MEGAEVKSKVVAAADRREREGLVAPHPMEGAAAPRRGRSGGPKPPRGSSSAARRGN
jgi:hypothetical protein